MADTPFRVLLDLRDLRIQSFKYVWISISPREIATIADFKSSILHKINLVRDDIKLFVRDGLLLDKETIAVLREDDTVRVQYEGQLNFVEDHVSNSNKETSKKRDYDECNQATSGANFTSNATSGAKIYKSSSNTFIHEEEMEVKNMRIKKKKKRKHSASHIEDDVMVQEYLQNLEESASCSYDNVQSVAKKSKKSKTPGTNDTPEQNDSVRSNIKDNNSAVNTISNKTATMASNANELQCVNAEIVAEPIVDATDNCQKDKLETRRRSKKISDNISGQDDKVRSNNSSNDSSPDNSSNRQAVKDLNTNEIQSENADMTAKSTIGARNNCHKKKRKRRRKRKSVCKPVVLEDPSLISNDTVFKSIVNTPSSSKGKHIVFSSPNSYVEPSYSESTELITVDYDETEEDIHHISSETYNKDDSTSNQPQVAYVKVSTPAQPNGNLTPNWDVSLMQNEHANPTNHKMDSMLQEIVENKHKETITGGVKLNARSKVFERDKLNYADLPVLKCQPEVGTRIAYKVLELDEYYSPVVSEYRMGVVSKIDPQTDEMVIELLTHHIKPGRVGKFENLKEDVIPPPEIIKEDILTWAALIEPKLLPR